MYSRATPFQKADKIAGTHQKIDRAARLVLNNLIKQHFKNQHVHFPSIMKFYALKEMVDLME